MKSFTSTTSIFFATLLAGTTLAAPSDSSYAVVEKRVFNAAFTLYAPSPSTSSYGLSIPCDDASHDIDNDLVIAKITGYGGEFCSFTGEQGASVVVFAEDTVDVSPPQKIVRVSCQTD